MLRWLFLTSVLTASFATFLVPPQEPNHAGDVLRQCHGRAWVRAPDMAPGEVIAGDVKIKLIGLCPNAESYTLGLRYKEKISWKLRQEKKNWMEYILKDGWSVHEEERIAFEIETDLVGDEGGNSLPTDFITRFGILVPNTNYPPGINYRGGQWPMRFLEGRHDSMWSDSVYEYFVKIRFSNGTTSEIPAGITTFIPFYLPTEKEAPPANLSLTRQDRKLNLKPDLLQSNYTVGVSFPDGAHVYPDSFANISAIVHRSGYTNRTDTPIQLCASLQLDIEWHPQELKNRPLLYSQHLSALVPSRSLANSTPFSSLPCREINFTEAATDVTREGYISSTFSEPLSLSFYVNRDIAPDFSTYYLKLGYHLNLNLHIELGSSVPWMDESEKQRWERGRERWESQQMDIDWVPWPRSIMGPPPPRLQFLAGQTDISVVPTQKQGPVRSIPVHYLSEEARQPLFFDLSDIDSLRLMSLEERDLIAPIAQPSLKVFDDAKKLGNMYFHMQRPIYVGDTWANKVLPTIVDGHRADGVGHSFVVQ